MNNHSSLHKRIDKMLAALHQQLPAESIYTSIKLHLFTEQEQDRIVKLQENILETGGMLEYLTENELEELCLWYVLEHALNDEDLATAQECRAALTIHQDQQQQQQRPSKQELIARFLQIDASLFNTPISPGPGIQLTNFHRLRGMIERGERLAGIDWTQLKWWNSYYERYPAMIASYAAHKAQYGRA